MNLETTMNITLVPNAPSAEYAAMGGMSCANWAKQPVYGCADIDDSWRPSYRAIATTEHPQSSYGLPVVVLADETVVGPADPVFHSISYLVVAAELNPLFERLKMAGYTVVAEEI